MKIIEKTLTLTDHSAGYRFTLVTGSRCVLFVPRMPDQLNDADRSEYVLTPDECEMLGEQLCLFAAAQRVINTYPEDEYDE